MIDKKITRFIEGLIIALIIIISAFLTYSILNRIEFLPPIKIIERENYWKLNIYIGEKELKEKIKELDLDNIIKENKNKEIIENKKEQKITNNNYLENYYKMSFNWKDFLLSNDKNSYNYWFITKNVKNNILYLYSHNSYKQTENSGYYLYNNLKLNDEIIFNDQDNYKIIKTELIDIDKNEQNNIKIPENSNIIYFTCTPYGDNIRKVYYFKKIKKE